jgi:membrane associated rhomboid family serine protease
VTPWPQQPLPIKVFATTCGLLELLAFAGDLAGANVRSVLIGIGGFWPGLMQGAAPLYPGQPVLMFATSAVLHGGLLHLFMNMVALMWLGPMIIERLGERAFWPVAGLSALGSGAVYALLSNGGTPMVGASGILFGLIGVLAAWSYFDRRASGESLRPLLDQTVAFLTLNIALTLLSSGMIAWQAHLGGLLAGIACGWFTWSGRLRARGI